MAKTKKKNKFTKYLLIGVGVLFIIAIVGKTTGIIGGSEATKVYTEKAEIKTIIESVSASGKIQPEVEIKISPDVSGEVTELYVKEGDQVTKGQILARIRPDVYQSMVDRSAATVSSTKANYENALSRLKQSESQFTRTEASFKRSQQLHKDKIISNSEYETALSSYEVAKSEVEAAKKSVEGAKFNVQSTQAGLKEANDNLAKTTIFAPVNGTISKLDIEAGERVVGTTQMAGTEMMRISNLNSMEVSVDVNENDINRVALNDSAIIEVDAIRGKKFKGIVTEIASSANSVGSLTDQVTNFTVKVRILLDGNKDAKLFRPGLSATCDVQTERAQNIVAIPIQAVTTRIDTSKKEKSLKDLGPPKDGEQDNENRKSNSPTEKAKEFVFVYANGKVEQREVKTGIQDENFIEIKSGIKKDEELVVAPYSAISKKLKNNSEVKKVSKDELFTVEK